MRAPIGYSKCTVGRDRTGAAESIKSRGDFGRGPDGADFDLFEGGSELEANQPVVVMAAEAIEGDVADRVVEEIRSGSANGPPEVRVVSPALAESALKHTFGDIDEAIDPARERLEKSLEALRSAGIEATGEVGDSDPVIAVGDQLRRLGGGRVVIVSHAHEDEQAHSEKDIIERIDREFDESAVALLVAGHGDSEHVEDEEEASRGAKRADEGHRFSANLPTFRLQDLAGILVAIIGTIVLIILAASCPDKGHEQGDNLGTVAGGCAPRYLLAGGFFLINMGHIGALLLMESTGYRGPFERFFARISVIGTPIAIVVSLLFS